MNDFKWMEVVITDMNIFNGWKIIANAEMIFINEFVLI